MFTLHAQFPPLPWTRGAPGAPGGVLAHLCVAGPVPWPAGLHECGLLAYWQLLAAAEKHFVHGVSGPAPCSGTPSAACIHPPAPEGATDTTTSNGRTLRFGLFFKSC